MIERMSSAFTSLTGLLISSSTLYWIGAVAERLMNKEALGQGDVKLLGFVGAFCGWQGGLFVIFGGALLGTVVLFPIMIISKFLKKSNANQEPDQLEKFYQAKRVMHEMINSDKYVLKFHLEPGSLLIMNNYRTLHGRTSYNTSEGSRWLQGLYIDHDSAESKYRLLAHG